jgi:2-phospho-L-lactate guanylyltransferase
MQGTVASFDQTTRSGRLLLDDGTQTGFDGIALDGTGLRLLRRGQRVRVEAVDGPAGLQVRRVQLLTLP